jgi:anti-sigma factor RsiW
VIVADAGEELEMQIDAYLDGRMDVTQRVQFEERMNKDPELRQRVLSATQSVSMVKQALGWVTPADDFDDQVSSKIVSITQSGINLRPALPSSERSLSADDMDADLLNDPDSEREKRRLTVLAVIAAVIFLAAAAAIVISIGKSAPQAPVPQTPR